MTKKLLFSITLDDCRVDTYTVGGHGGAGKDTSNSGVRVTHLASGAVGQCNETRSQHKNKAVAFRRMAYSIRFREWHRAYVKELISGKNLEQRVEEDMQPQNLKIEYRDARGKWVKND